MGTYTNRILEARTPYSHKQLKRWAVAFLPSAGSPGQHSGIEREYTLDEAFVLLLGGGLVAWHGFTIKEAKTLVAEVIVALQAEKILPSDLLALERREWPEQIIVEYGKTIRGRYRLEVAKILQVHPTWAHKQFGEVIATFSTKPRVFGDRKLWNEPPRQFRPLNLLLAMLEDPEDDEDDEAG